MVEHDKSGRLLGQRHVDDAQTLRLPGVQILRIKHSDRSSSCFTHHNVARSTGIPLKALKGRGDCARPHGAAADDAPPRGERLRGRTSQGAAPQINY
ncbi:hypothetical protein GCM10010287_61160 [Streptomyces variabilis]|uniref:Transposase n=1 Tax=Streptomyces variabilis TaxID=67372 RepID=A0ABQ2U7K9_9ACTN|nr:hypothetical protein GCM10010265_07470 [Streptomyces griseoincarnatus]GGT78547.1 hypothetical protein GCM10010287_61160 [Streptomyces variabilis]